MKKRYAILTAGLMLAGTALWCGCSNNELIENTINGTEIQKQAEGFSFYLKGTGSKTRATQTAESDESKVNTMYVALFIKNEGEDETTSKLHRVFFYDAKNSDSSWSNDLKMTYANADGEKFTITKENMANTNTYTGTYFAYFIANPEDAIKAELKTFLATDGASRTTLSTFETTLMAKAEVDGGTGDSSRGFTMLSGKETIEIAESPRTKNITLTRLAARFDFINSSPANVAITSVKFNNMAKQSYLVPQSVNTPEGNLYGSSEAATTKNWPSASGGGEVPTSMKVYTYENLNTQSLTDSKNNMLYTSITVNYTLDADGAASGSSPVNKTLRIDLKEGDTPLAVMRNHLYKINMNCVTGTYELTVQDWVGGETVTVPNKDLAITYTADSLGKIGDYVYNNNGVLAFSDGGLRKMYLDGSLGWDDNGRPSIKTDRGTCIGVVFSNMTSKTDFEAGYKNGYILCNQNITAANNQQWKTTNSDDGLPKITSIAAAFADLDGRTNCDKLKGNINSYPQLKALQNNYAQLPTLPAQPNISEWYIPSIGQWLSIAKNLGRTELTGDQWLSSSRYETGWIVGPNEVDTFVNNIKSIMTSLKSPSSLISNIAPNIGWGTSSEYDATQHYRLVIAFSGAIKLNPIAKDVGGTLVYVAAF